MPDAPAPLIDAEGTLGMIALYSRINVRRYTQQDLDLLVSGPVDWLKLYAAKLLETVVNSSWMVVLMAVPMFAAYGYVYDGGWLEWSHDPVNNPIEAGDVLAETAAI